MLEKKPNFRAWLFGLESFKKRLLQIIFDGLLAKTALLLAFFLRLDTTDFLYKNETYIGVFIVIVTTLSIFAVRGLYNNITRHISFETAYSIAIGSAVSCTVLICSIFLLKLEIPRSVPLIYATLLCVFATSMRFFIRSLGQNMIEGKIENVAIYGTGTDSIQLMDALSKNTNYRVRMLIDEDPEIHAKNIGGIPIFKLNEALKQIKKIEIKILFIVVPNDIQAINQQILDVLSEHPLVIKKIPSISTLVSGKTKVSDLEDINIEDLLGRKPAEYSPELMAKTITGKTVFVTGSGGSIGSELCRQIIMLKPKKLIMLDISEYAIYELIKDLNERPSSQELDLIPLIGSVQDRQLIKKIFDLYDVDTTYHAAAYKHVPLMERNVMQCIANNVFGTLNMVELAIAAKVKNFVLVSTDKAVNPTNFMGASKRFAEIICKTLQTQKSETCLSIVRFGNVLGSSGSVVPLFKKQIKNGGPITLTHLEMTRYFMTISEASQLVIQAASIAKSGDIFVLDMGEPVKILELAKRMAALSGLKPILNVKEKLKDDEVAIIVTGLRPGEKLFEELSYSKNLQGTVNPKINTTAEKPMKRDRLEALLKNAGDAIRDNDHHMLYQVLDEVTGGAFEVDGSVDKLIDQNDGVSSKITSTPLRSEK